MSSSNCYFLPHIQVSQETGKVVWYAHLLKNFPYAEYIMRNAGLEETQAGIKIAGRNIKHLRYADDTTLMAGRAKKKS